MLDLLVVGGGLSGLMAAYTAARAGLKVKVISKGLGLLHWGAGTIDLYGCEPADFAIPIENPLEAIGKLNESRQHPYALVGEKNIAAMLEDFLKITQEIGLPYEKAAGDKNILLPSPAGAARPAYLAPQAQIAGDLSQADPMLIVGFAGMRDFFPALIAENLVKSGYQARALILPNDLLTARRDANNVQLAEGLEDGAQRTRLSQALKASVQTGERIGIPAILGVARHREVFADLENLCGAPLFEIPTLPPSVPGIRLYTTLRDHLRKMGVRVEPAMEVTNAGKRVAQNGTAGQVDWLESETSARPLKHRAKNYLLATGGILGDGFHSDLNGRVWEVILDLPLTIPQDRSKWFNSQFLNPGGHPVFIGGVQVNSDFQPIDAHGTILYDNLWVAGQMIAGASPILERSVEGIAIITGMAAGKAVSKK